MMRVARSLLVLSLASSLAACSSDDGSFFDNSSSGAAGGGNSGQGGSTTTGGTASASGGSMNDSGGSAAAGVATGGGPVGGNAGGGVPATGGSNPALGGAANGGADGGTAPSMGGAAQAGGGMGGGAAGGKAIAESGSHEMTRFRSAPHCETVAFTSEFAEDRYDIGVQVSVLHPGLNTVQDPLAVWVESITLSSFDVCLAEDADGDNSHPASRVDWLAYRISEVAAPARAARENFGGQRDQACAFIEFEAPFAAPPQVHASLNHQGSDESARESATVWLENIDETGFLLCVQELPGNDGALDGVNIDWLAYPAPPPDGFKAGEADFPSFSGTRCVDIETGCANCGAALLTVNHRRTEESTPHDATLLWAGDFSAEGVLRACARELSSANGSHDAHLSVDWLVRESN
jgi:hypothetical protein